MTMIKQHYATVTDSSTLTAGSRVILTGYNKQQEKYSAMIVTKYQRKTCVTRLSLRPQDVGDDSDDGHTMRRITPKKRRSPRDKSWRRGRIEGRMTV